MNEFRKEGMTATTDVMIPACMQPSSLNAITITTAAGRVYGHDYDDWFNGADKPAFRKFMPADMAGLGNQLLCDKCSLNALFKCIAHEGGGFETSRDIQNSRFR